MYLCVTSVLSQKPSNCGSSKYAVMVQPLRIGMVLALFLLSGTSRLGLNQAQAHSGPPGHKDQADWAQTTLGSLTLEEKVGQLFMVRLHVEQLRDSAEYLRLRDTIHRYRVGALAMSAPRSSKYLRRDRGYETVTLLNDLQRESKLPLLVAGDFE